MFGRDVWRPLKEISEQTGGCLALRYVCEQGQKNLGHPAMKTKPNHSFPGDQSRSLFLPSSCSDRGEGGGGREGQINEQTETTQHENRGRGGSQGRSKAQRRTGKERAESARQRRPREGLEMTQTRPVPGFYKMLLWRCAHSLW